MRNFVGFIGVYVDLVAGVRFFRRLGFGWGVGIVFGFEGGN
jgi:hypothetical protein